LNYRCDENNNILHHYSRHSVLTIFPLFSLPIIRNLLLFLKLKSLLSNFLDFLKLKSNFGQGILRIFK
jgi:hypothetical protein